MKIFRFSLLILFLHPAISRSETTYGEGFPPPPEQSDGWVALPHSRPFPSLLSDPRDLRLGLRKNNKEELEADVGGYRSLAGWKGDCHGESLVFHTGIEGNGYFVMRQEGSRFPLLSSDGLIGLYGEAARGLWMYQLRYTHISAHLSDGLTSKRSAITYTRETLSLRAARQLGPWRAYAGYHLLTHTMPSLPRHALQLGAYGILPLHWGIAHPYFGGDLRIRNAAEGTTFQLAAGTALVPSAGGIPVRITASYLKGHDLRGQFYSEKTEKWTFGLDLDL
ncbi:MAG TPA: hypothetical protein VIH99_09060 [Bdellovibrionota bacterium]|jgi:hypothetical protein